MIISLKHRFIFAAVPKTGTHAVRRALRLHMGEQDMEQVGLFVQRKLPIPELARFQHGHLTLEQLRPFIPPGDFAGFLKFAFVRNPFDRFVSYCSFVTRDTGDFDREPQRVMRHFIENPPWHHILFQPQHRFIAGAGGELLTDYLGRVESMQQSYDEVAAKIGIASQELEKVNASRRGGYRDYYDQPLIAGVARLYERDLELFGYEF